MSISNPTLSSAPSLEKKRKHHSDHLESTQKVQNLVHSEAMIFFRSSLNEKQGLLHRFSTNELYRMLKDENAASLIEAAQSNHPFFITCLNRLNQKKLQKLCSLKDKEGNSVGISIIQSCPKKFLKHLLSFFQTKQVIQKFFLLTNHPTTNQKKKKTQPSFKENIFRFLPNIPDKKLSLLINKLLKTSNANFVATILYEHKKFTDLNELQELPDIIEFLAQEPFSEKIMEVFYLLIKAEMETDNSANSKILPLINKQLLRLSNIEKQYFLKKYLSKILIILERSNKSNLAKEILKLVTLGVDAATTRHFLAKKDSNGMILLEKILVLANESAVERESLDFSCINSDLLMDLLSNSSRSSPDHQIIYHFIRAISLGKIHRSTLTVRYFYPNLYKQVLLFFDQHKDLYDSWMRQMYDISLQSFCSFFLILRLENDFKNKTNTEQFSPHLKIFTNEELFLIAYLFAQPPPNSHFSTNYRYNILGLISEEQYQYIKQRVKDKLNEFLELEPSTPMENFMQYPGFIFLHNSYSLNIRNIIRILQSPNFLRLSENPSCGLRMCQYFFFTMSKELKQSLTPEAIELMKNFINKSCMNFSKEQLYDLFLSFITNDFNPYFITFENAIELIVSQDHTLRILKNIKLQKWLAKDQERATKSYFFIEKFLMDSITESLETLNSRQSNAISFLNYIFENFRNMSTILYGCQNNNIVFHCRYIIELTLKDKVCNLNNLDLSIFLLLSRLRFLEKDTMMQILNCNLYQDENFFCKFMLLASLAPGNTIKIINHLIKNLSLENFMHLSYMTLKNLESNLLARGIISNILTFILSQPKKIMHLWVRNVFMQQGRSKYIRYFPLLLNPEITNPNHDDLSYKTNRALILNILRITLDLPKLPLQELGNPSNTLLKATEVIIQAFTFSREDEEQYLNLNKKKEMLLAYNYLCDQTNTNLNILLLNFLDKKNRDEKFTATFLSLFEISFLSEFLICNHLCLEDYPLLQLPLAPQENVNIEDLLTLFKNYTYSDTSSPNQLDLSEMYQEHCTLLMREYQEQQQENILNPPVLQLPSKEEFKVYLDTLFEKLLKTYIPNRVAVTGLSSDNEIREREYQTIENKLKIITAFLNQQQLQLTSTNDQERENAKINLTAFLPILASLATSCATRWMGEMEELLNIIATQQKGFDFSKITQLYRQYNQSYDYGESSLQENYRLYCIDATERGALMLPKESYYESLYAELDDLFLNLIPNRLIELESEPDIRENQYKKIEEHLHFLTSFICAQMQLLQNSPSQLDSAKNELDNVFLQLMELRNCIGIEFINKLEALVTSISDNQREVNSYTKKGKLLKTIQRSYNQRLFGIPNASNVHWLQLYKKIIWKAYPFLIENLETLNYKDPLEPKKNLPDGSQTDYIINDLYPYFFGENSLNKFEESLLNSLNSLDKYELKKQYGTQEITDVLIFEIKKRLIKFAKFMIGNEESDNFDSLTVECLPLVYDETGNLNEVALLLLLNHSKLLQPILSL